MGKKQAKGNLLPFSLVEQAASGDIEAIDQILRHYAGYIRTLATRKFYDEYAYLTFAWMKRWAKGWRSS